jgi:hypothetical protein
MDPPLGGPVVLDTFAACLRHRHALRAFCPGCRRWALIDLAALVREGQGGRRLVGCRLRCCVCGGAGALQLCAPMPGWAGPATLGGGQEL